MRRFASILSVLSLVGLLGACAPKERPQKPDDPGQPPRVKLELKYPPGTYRTAIDVQGQSVKWVGKEARPPAKAAMHYEVELAVQPPHPESEKSKKMVTPVSLTIHRIRADIPADTGIVPYALLKEPLVFDIGAGASSGPAPANESSGKVSEALKAVLNRPFAFELDESLTPKLAKEGNQFWGEFCRIGTKDPKGDAAELEQRQFKRLIAALAWPTLAFSVIGDKSQLALPADISEVGQGAVWHVSQPVITPGLPLLNVPLELTLEKLERTPAGQVADIALSADISRSLFQPFETGMAQEFKAFEEKDKDAWKDKEAAQYKGKIYYLGLKTDGRVAINVDTGVLQSKESGFSGKVRLWADEPATVLDPLGQNHEFRVDIEGKMSVKVDFTAGKPTQPATGPESTTAPASRPASLLATASAAAGGQ